MGDECEMCQNCKRDIPVANYRMHTLHCSRNVVLCPECQEPVPRSGLEDHREEEHAQRECELCKEMVAPKDVRDHKSSICPERVIVCQYCELDCKARNIMEHEIYCGSRTEKCPECSDFVMLRDWKEHQKMTLYHELAKKPCSIVFGYNPMREIGPPESSVTTATTSPIPPLMSVPKPQLHHQTPSTSLGPRRKLSDTTNSLPKPRELTIPNSRKISEGSLLGQGLVRRPGVNSRSLIDEILGGESNIGDGEDTDLPPPLEPVPGSNFVDNNLGDGEEEELIPCEFCLKPIPILQLIKHQTDCTRNEDSFYYNPNPGGDSAAVTMDANTYANVPKITDAVVASKAPSPPHLISFDDEDRGEPPKSFGGARPKMRCGESGSSIVGKYLQKSNEKGNNGNNSSNLQKKASAELVKKENNRLREMLKESEANRIANKSTFANQRKQPPPSAGNFNAKQDNVCPVSSPTEPCSTAYSEFPKLTKGEQLPTLFPKPSISQYNASSSIRKTSAPSSLSVRPKDGDDDVANDRDLQEREKLRLMLSELRKDPFDEDLENNDGAFFPCEFCGDPYPVEFLMRHQLSCDLNPAPVSSGQGFDYTLIRNRAEQNLELAKPPFANGQS